MTDNPKICATIEARMSSSRLPGKVMMKHEGVPLVKIMVDRIRKSKFIDSVIVATTTNTNDDSLCEYLKSEEIDFYRGSEENVLQRVLDSADSHDCDIIVELTGDCPLIDHAVIDEAIEAFLSNPEVDYVANTTITNSYPRGSDVQVFTTETLRQVSKETNDLDDLENVSYYIYRTEGRFNLLPMNAPSFDIHPDTRLTLDYPQDLDLICSVLTELGHDASLQSICEFLNKNPETRNINTGISVTYINDQNRNS